MPEAQLQFEHQREKSEKARREEERNERLAGAIGDFLLGIDKDRRGGQILNAMAAAEQAKENFLMAGRGQADTEETFQNMAEGAFRGAFKELLNANVKPEARLSDEEIDELIKILRESA